MRASLPALHSSLVVWLLLSGSSGCSAASSLLVSPPRFSPALHMQPPPSLHRSARLSTASGVTEAGAKQEHSVRERVIASWGVLSVLVFLLAALRRLLPVALEPLLRGDLSPWQGGLYMAWVGAMAYVEGYRAFHLKFSPLVVKRSFVLAESPRVWKCVLAGPYAMGLVGANQRRTIVSWAMIVGVMLLVQGVKMLTYPWRGIVDAGVVGGLSVGAASMVWLLLQGLAGRVPQVDPCLPASYSKQQ